MASTEARRKCARSTMKIHQAIGTIGECFRRGGSEQFHQWAKIEIKMEVRILDPINLGWAMELAQRLKNICYSIKPRKPLGVTQLCKGDGLCD